MSTIQPSSLLPTLLDGIDEEQLLTVLHIGPAVPETVEFFCHYRCKLHFIDLFSELDDLQVEDDDASGAQAALTGLLQLPADTRIDLCLFWDLFNHLQDPLISALATTLRPHLHGATRGHCFAVHNPRTPQYSQRYGIRQADALCVRQRPAPLPGYHPRNRGQLEKWLPGFRVSRSVLLADGRLEVLLQAAARPR